MLRRMLCGVIAGLLLCGCSAVRNPEKLAASVKEAYDNAAAIELTADITSSRNEETQIYQIAYDYKKTDAIPTAQMTILAPESIAGITAEITGEDFRFAYADTQLETAMPDRKGLTPADAVTYLLDDLMHHVPAQVWLEHELLVLRYEDRGESGTAVRDVMLEPETGILKGAHIFFNGKQIMTCTFSKMELQAG